MRSIEVDTEVFAAIWARRQDGEESENDILRRLLSSNKNILRKAAQVGARVDLLLNPMAQSAVKVLWRDDVRQALTDLGGTAPLAQIYRMVREMRKSGGRSLPPSTDDIIRRELENNSSESHAYTGQRDWFKPAMGLGEGVWSLKE